MCGKYVFEAALAEVYSVVTIEKNLPVKIDCLKLRARKTTYLIYYKNKK